MFRSSTHTLSCNSLDLKQRPWSSENLFYLRLLFQLDSISCLVTHTVSRILTSYILSFQHVPPFVQMIPSKIYLEDKCHGHILPFKILMCAHACMCACMCVCVCLCMKMHACVFVEVGGQPEIPSSGVSPTPLRQGLSLPGAHQIGPTVPEILLSLSLPLSDYKHEPLSLTFKCRFWRPGAGASVCKASALPSELSAQSLRYSFSPGFHDALLTTQVCGEGRRHKSYMIPMVWYGLSSLLYHAKWHETVHAMFPKAYMFACKEFWA